MAISFTTAPYGLVSLAPVPANQDATYLGYFYLDGTVMLSGTFRTFFYTGDSPATYSQGVWIGQVGDAGGPNENKLEIFNNATSSLALSAAGFGTAGWYQIAYRRSGTQQSLYVDQVEAAFLVQDMTAQTHTHHLVGTDTLALDWDPGKAAYIRVFAAALTIEQLSTEGASRTPVLTSSLWADYPLTDNLLDASGNGRHFSYYGISGFVASPSIPPVSLTGCPVTLYPGAGTP